MTVCEDYKKLLEVKPATTICLLFLFCLILTCITPKVTWECRQTNRADGASGPETEMTDWQKWLRPSSSSSSLSRCGSWLFLFFLSFFQFDLCESTRIITGIRIKDLDLWRELLVEGGVLAIIKPSVVSGQLGRCHPRQAGAGGDAAEDKARREASSVHPTPLCGWRVHLQGCWERMDLQKPHPMGLWRW